MDNLFEELRPAEEEPVQGPVIPGIAEHLARLTGQDVLAEDHADIWCQALPGWLDLKVEMMEPGDIGNPALWMAYVDGPLSDAMDLGWSSEHLDGVEVSRHGIDWALAHGVAPGQPFLLRVYRTEGSKSWTDCGWEYDAWNEWEVLCVRPWSVARVVRAWTKYLADRRSDARAVDAQRKRQWEAAQLDAKNLQLQWSTYFGPGQRYHDDMEMPAGLGVALQWYPDGPGHRCEVLASGRSDKGDQEGALRELEAALVRLPFLSIGPAELRRLPRRNIW